MPSLRQLAASHTLTTVLCQVRAAFCSEAALLPKRVGQAVSAWPRIVPFEGDKFSQIILRLR